MMNMIPNLIIATSLILVGIWLGKFISNFVESFLTRVGFDKVSANMKLGNKAVSNNKMTPSTLVGYVVQVLIVFFLTVQSLYLIKLDFLVNIASAITAYLPHVLAAVLILGGLALAFGLAFGLGGKEFATKYLKKADEALEQMKTKKTE